MQYVKEVSRMEIYKRFNAINQIKSVVDVKWQCLDSGWITINCDGVMGNLEAKAGSKGLLRNEKEGWIFGYIRNLGQL